MASKFRDSLAVRKELVRRRQGTDIPASVWDFLVKKAWVQAVIRGEREIEWLFLQVEDLEEVHAAGATTSKTTQPKVIRRDVEPDFGARALAEIMSLDAEKNQYLQEFRRLISYPGPITSTEEGWSALQAQEALKRYGRSDVAEIHNESGPRARKTVDEAMVMLAFHVRYFRKELNDAQLADYWSNIRTARGYAIEEDDTSALFDFGLCLTDVLSTRYGWPWSDTQNFALGGEPPRLPLAWVQYKPRTDYPEAAFVELRVTPNMSPRDVMDLYGSIRRQIKGSDSRYRPLDEIKSRLAVFAARHNDGQTWEEALKIWNHANPDHRYDEPRSFTRDCRESYKRVTGLDLDWAGNRRKKGGS